ncbi:MAG: response regulator, partial [Muribaculaceae bacterium]|nr:response regulator [Muribaculaceae bacterium]
IIFLDHLMPDMDGIETLSHIRSMGQKYTSLPVIALTANVMSGAKERYLNAGFTDFLEKPINAAKLDEILLNYLPAEYIKLV